MDSTGQVLAAWGVMMLAVVVGRARFHREGRDLRDLPALELETPQIRRGVVTSLAVAIPGLADLAATDPHRAHLVLLSLAMALEQVGRDQPFERDPPLDGLFRLYLGRGRAVPDHRGRGLALALALKDALREVLVELGLPPPAIGLATDDSLTTPLLDRRGPLTVGRAPARARELASMAAPGEIRVDGVRPAADAAFRFETEGEVRRLVGREVEPSRS